MRPIRAIAVAILLASIAVAGCGGRQSDQRATSQSGQPATTASPTINNPTTPGDTSNSEPVVLANGRHPVLLKTIDPGRGRITFDLIQFYQGDQATTQAAKDHQESPPPNDYYIRNVNPKLRTLPVQADATITANQLAGSNQDVPVTLAKLATLTHERSPVFWLTVRHDQVVKIGEQWVP
jgi:hypothetical protein